MTRSVLFVCTGNTCRSPMAEWIFLRLCGEAGLEISAASAGTEARPGMPLSKGAAEITGETGHLARRVDRALLDRADAVYVMERAHVDFLRASFPSCAAKVALLREDAGLPHPDVADPISGDASKYSSCAASIEEALRIIVLREKKSHAQNSR